MWAQGMKLTRCVLFHLVPIPTIVATRGGDELPVAFSLGVRGSQSLKLLANVLCATREKSPSRASGTDHSDPPVERYEGHPDARNRYASTYT